LATRLGCKHIEPVIYPHGLLKIRELRELSNELCVVLRLERILILELSDKQLEKLVPTHRLFGAAEQTESRGR
jgi:hypothetical protein